MIRKIKLGLFFLGSYPLFKFANQTQNGFRHYFLNSNPNLNETYGVSENENYVVITGSTSGLGQEFANQLAQQGHNLVLISRNEQRLRQQEKELQSLFPQIKVQTIPFDFSTINLSSYDQLFQQLDKYNVSILVNNVGTINHPEFFAKQNLEQKNKLNVTNTLPNTLLMNHLIPKFYEKFDQSQKKSAIINIGSSLPQHSNYPLQADYSASKAYVNHLTRCLQKEVDNKKVDILLVTPTNVKTNVGQKLTNPVEDQKKLDYFDKEFQFQKYAYQIAEESSTIVKNALNNVGHTNEIYGSYKLGVAQHLANVLDTMNNAKNFWVRQFNQYSQVEQPKQEAFVVEQIRIQVPAELQIPPRVVQEIVVQEVIETLPDNQVKEEPIVVIEEPLAIQIDITENNQSKDV